MAEGGLVYATLPVDRGGKCWKQEQPSPRNAGYMLKGRALDKPGSETLSPATASILLLMGDFQMNKGALHDLTLPGGIPTT